MSILYLYIKKKKLFYIKNKKKILSCHLKEELSFFKKKK